MCAEDGEEQHVCTQVPAFILEETEEYGIVASPHSPTSRDGDISRIIECQSKFPSTDPQCSSAPKSKQSSPLSSTCNFPLPSDVLKSEQAAKCSPKNCTLDSRGETSCLPSGDTLNIRCNKGVSREKGWDKLEPRLTLSDIPLDFDFNSTPTLVTRGMTSNFDSGVLALNDLHLEENTPEELVQPKRPGSAHRKRKTGISSPCSNYPTVGAVDETKPVCNVDGTADAFNTSDSNNVTINSFDDVVSHSVVIVGSTNSPPAAVASRGTSYSQNGPSKSICRCASDQEVGLGVPSCELYV